MKNARPIIATWLLLTCFAQSKPAAAQTRADTLAAQKLFVTTLNFMRQNQLDSMKIYAERTEPAYRKLYGENSALYANILELQTFYFQNTGQFDTAYLQLLRVLRIREQVFGGSHHKTANIYNNIGTFLMQFREDYAAALPFLEKAYAIDKKNGEEKEAIVTLVNISVALDRQGDRQRALQTTDDALQTAVRLFGESSLDVTPFYELAGIRYFDQGNSAKSIEFFQKSLAIRRQHLPEISPDIISTRVNLANSLASNHNFEAALILYEKLIADCQQPGSDISDRQRALILSDCAAGLQRMGKNDRALHCLIASLAIQTSFLPPDDPQLWLHYRHLAQLHFSQKNYSETERYLALEHRVASQMPRLKPDDQAEFHRLAGGVAQAHGQWAAADSLFALSLADYRAEPKTSPYFGSLSPERAMGCLGQRIFFELARYRQHRNPDFLKFVKKYGSELDQAMQAFRLASDREGSKTARFEEIKTALEAVIWANLQLATHFPQQSEFADDAFALAEKSRAFLLFEKVRGVAARSFANIPPALLQNWDDLQHKIAATERTQFQLLEKNTSPTDPSFLALGTQLFEQRQEADGLQQQFEADFPDYFQLKYNLATISLAEIQRDLLAPDQTLVEFFVGDSAIFIFRISKTDFQVEKIEKKFPLETWVADLRHATTDFFTDPRFSEKYDSLAQIFTDRSHALFQKLIAPVAANLTQKLIIVPDGVLGLLPFELLLQTPAAAVANRFQQHNYLIFKHSVSYCPSATMLREMSAVGGRTPSPVSFFGFAPHFTGDTAALAEVFKNDLTMRRDLTPLPFSGEEVARCAKIMRGNYAAGADATRQNFEKIAPTARILHLATHGQANDRAGDYCFLAFAQNSLLFAREIYNLKLNADLVTLSACETGIGQVQTGEGIISLARAFAYAGARSIVTSLWSVSDSKTKDLMLDFYRNLRRGLPKDESLRQAKLDFLKKNKGQAAHPFYWAGFVGIGNMEPLSN